MSHSFAVLGPDAGADLSSLIAIYQEAIDPSEQKSPAEIAAMLSDPRYLLLVSRTSGIVSGFAICFYPEGADFWLLEYMAVDADMRGRRIGEAIFMHTYAVGLERDASRIMVLEVDQPGGSTNPRNDTRARYRFYQRMNCRRIAGLDYILPLETGGTPPPMMLLVCREPPLTAVAKARIASWLATLYRQVYGQAPDDPRIEGMVSRLDDSVQTEPLR